MSAVENRNGVQSVEIAAAILAAMAEAGSPLALKEIARRTGQSPGKVHRYLVSLGRCDLVRQEAETSRYAIGAASIALGLSGLRSVNVVRSASEILSQIRDRVGETVVLAMWSRNGPVVVQLEESSRQIFMNVRVGSALPLLTSAVGRVYAAYLPRSVTENILRREIEKSAGDFRAIDKLLDETRALRLGTVKGDLVPGVAAISAPILDHQGKIASCIGVLGRSEDLDIDPRGEAASVLASYADMVSRQIGYPGEGGPAPLRDVSMRVGSGSRIGAPKGA